MLLSGIDALSLLIAMTISRSTCRRVR
ncbi:hypothetical protein F1954_12800, partial [Akkermansia sp. BIOML-A6]